MEAYLVLYHSDGDEVHADLVDKSTYDAICIAVNNGDSDGAMDAHFSGNILQRFMMQTMCIDKWPYNGAVVKGTVCIWVY